MKADVNQNRCLSMKAGAVQITLIIICQKHVSHTCANHADEGCSKKARFFCAHLPLEDNEDINCTYIYDVVDGNAYK